MSVVFTCIQLTFAAEICSYSAWLNTYKPTCMHMRVRVCVSACVCQCVCVCVCVCVCARARAHVNASLWTIFCPLYIEILELLPALSTNVANR